MGAALCGCLPCVRRRSGQKYAVDEVQVPDQCGSLWQAIQRAIASNGKIKTVCMAKGDSQMGDEWITSTLG